MIWSIRLSAHCLKLCGKYIYVAHRRRLGQALCLHRIAPAIHKALGECLTSPKTDFTHNKGLLDPHPPFQRLYPSKLQTVTHVAGKGIPVPLTVLSRRSVGILLVFPEACKSRALESGQQCAISSAAVGEFAFQEANIRNLIYVLRL